MICGPGGSGGGATTGPGSGGDGFGVGAGIVSHGNHMANVAHGHVSNLQVAPAASVPLTRTRRVLRGHTAQTTSGERVLLINYISPNASSAAHANNTILTTPGSGSCSGSGISSSGISSSGISSSGSASASHISRTNTSIPTHSAPPRKIIHARTVSGNRPTATPVSFAGLGSEVTVTLTRSSKSSAAGHIVRHQPATTATTITRGTIHEIRTTPTRATTTTTLSSSPPPLVFAHHSELQQHELTEVEEVDENDHHHHHHRQQHHQQQQQHQRQQQHQQQQQEEQLQHEQQVVLHQEQEQQESDHVQHYHTSQQHVAPHLMTSIQTQTQTSASEMDEELLEYNNNTVEHVVDAVVGDGNEGDDGEGVEEHHLQQLQAVQVQVQTQQQECIQDDEGEVEEVYLQ